MLSSPQKALALVSVLGAALLIIGLVLRDSEILVLPGVRLSTLADALGVAAVILSIAAQMDRLLKMGERTEAELREVRKALSDTHMAKVNKIIAQLRQENRPIQTASSNMLERLAITVLPNLANDLLRMNEKADNYPIPIYDLQTISMILEELAKQLPNGSVWLGLSKLPHPDAWSTAFSNWNELLMDRCERKEMHVCRVWPLHSDAQLHNLEEVLQLQKKTACDCPV